MFLRHTISESVWPGDVDQKPIHLINKSGQLSHMPEL
jgi:hypothetical protein